jgi:tetratricopeptide (TPR) repeat protein
MRRMNGAPARGRRAIRVLAAVLLGCGLPPAGARAHDDPDATIQRLDVKIAAHPDDAGLWQSRSVLHRRAGDFARAHADLDRSVELGLGAADADRDRGLIRFEEGRLDEAEALLRLAREQTPDAPATLLGHARVLVALGRFDEATATYARIVSRAPQSAPDVWLEHVHAAAACDRADALGAAIQVADAGIAAIGSVPGLEQAALDLELRTGRVDAALARLDRMAARIGRRDAVLIQRAEILERAGRPMEAKAAYAEALAALESLPDARRTSLAARETEAQARNGIARLAQGEQE